MTKIYLMVRSDFESFVELLEENIPSRNHAGYPLLISEITTCDLIHEDKLAALITGRSEDGEVLFAQGNFDTGFMSYQKYFDASRWGDMMKLPDGV